MNKKKILVLAVSVALIAILAIGGSLAYFTDTTDLRRGRQRLHGVHQRH